MSYLWKLRLDEKLVKKVNSRINSSNRGGLMKFVPFVSVCVCVYNMYIDRIRIYEWCKMSRETFVLKVFLFHFFPLSCHSWSENLNLSLSLSLMKIIFGYIIYPRLVLIHNNHCDDILVWCVHIFINFAMFFFLYIFSFLRTWPRNCNDDGALVKIRFTSEYRYTVYVSC